MLGQAWDRLSCLLQCGGGDAVVRGPATVFRVNCVAALSGHDEQTGLCRHHLISFLLSCKSRTLYTSSSPACSSLIAFVSLPMRVSMLTSRQAATAMEKVIWTVEVKHSSKVSPPFKVEGGKHRSRHDYSHHVGRITPLTKSAPWFRSLRSLRR